MKSSYASKLAIMLCCVGYDACLLSLHLDMCSKFVWHHTLSHCTLVLEVYKTYSALTFLDTTIFSLELFQILKIIILCEKLIHSQL